MAPIRIFISSVQGEFSAERAALRDYLKGDPLMRRFFEAFLFEDVPAADRRPDALYLQEVDIYVGLFGRPVRRHHAGARGRQARATSKAARVRVARLNSTPSRWIGSPRPRYLSA